MKRMALCVALTAATAAVAPIAHADMLTGNYVLDAPRDPGHSWI